MKTLTIFDAMIRARDEMDIDAEKYHRRLYRKHKRQYNKFNAHIRNILNNDLTLNELRRLMQSKYNSA